MNLNNFSILAQAGGEAVGGLIVIAICVGLCIAINQPRTKVTTFGGQIEEKWK